MGIREKIMLGFLSLGLLLFLSGLMSYFELNKLSSSTQNMLDTSFKNMELSKDMLDAVQDQNTALLQMIVAGNNDADTLLMSGRKKFDATIKLARVTIRDIQGIDSIYAASIRYNNVINSHFSDSLKLENIYWFVNIYKTSYYNLTASIKNYMISTQITMDDKATQLESNAYRAIMPGVIALAIAIIILVMFFYFIDLYYIRPVMKITASLNNHLNLKIPFKVTMEGRDEVYKLKEQIEQMIGLLKTKKSE